MRSTARSTARRGRPRFVSWFHQTPDDFVFALKGPKFITHVRRLKDAGEPLARFFGTGILRLNQKLGPILWQLPPSLQFDPALLEAFLAQLPHDAAAAADMADNLSNDARSDADRPLRHAIEVRHDSFATPEFVQMLRKHRVAAVVADSGGKWPEIEDVTADFVYARLHGVAEIYKSGYTDAALDQWATKLRAWREGGEPKGVKHLSPKGPPKRTGRDVFAYFDVEEKVFSPTNAVALAERMRAIE